MAITSCFGVNNTFCMEEDEYNTSDSYDNNLGKINSVMKTIRINGKSFQVTPEEMMNYPVLGYFYRNYINQLEADDENNDSNIFKDSERNLKNEDKDVINILEKLTIDIKKAQENLEEAQKKKDIKKEMKTKKIEEMLCEIKNYIVEKVFPSSESERFKELDQKVEELERNSISNLVTVLKIGGKNFNVLKGIVNEYPVLKEFANKNPFSGEYTFQQCRNMTSILQDSITKFEKNGTEDEAEEVKKLFLEIRNAIESAIRKLPTDNPNQAREMNKFVRDVLSTEIIEKINIVFKHNK